MQVGVSAEQLAKLRTGKYSELVRSGAITEDTCTVCQEQYGPDDVVTQLPCGHWFRQGCIAEWLKGSKMCPVCMAEVAENKTEPAGSTP